MSSGRIWAGVGTRVSRPGGMAFVRTARPTFCRQPRSELYTTAAALTQRNNLTVSRRTPAVCPQIPLYDRGYEKDPSKVAGEAIRQAQRDGCDCVLVDTAGRMQDNEPLMRALASLIAVNEPNLVLFVGEALVRGAPAWCLFHLQLFCRLASPCNPGSGFHGCLLRRAQPGCCQSA